MNASSSRLYLLGSRSPRRLELLRSVVDESRIRVMPPRTLVEPGFLDCRDLESIEARLRHIARLKYDDVCEQLAARPRMETAPADVVVITADTVIVVAGESGSKIVLGQPPFDADWRDTVRHWFREHYCGKTHQAASAVLVARPAGVPIERVVWTDVTFHGDVDRWLDWYLAIGEPAGKAGGYALQGAGSIFVSQVQGSLSNVVGLPLRELLEAFDELQIDYRADKVSGTLNE